MSKKKKKKTEQEKEKKTLSLKDLDVRVSELRDHELLARPVNHVGH
ncbi:hypothetical protein CULT_1810005 [[Clostridium] ultunense Esp]|nr:hypothetical protein CULT_1810005 [[Clostridium] ultunense Esp]